MSWLGSVVGGGLGYAVAGPAGAVVGAVAGGSGSTDKGYDLSDVPMGVHVEARWQDDEVGRRWSLSFLSALPLQPISSLRLLNDAGQPLLGEPPFVDAAGDFAAAAAIRERQSVLYIPFAAARYTRPKHISLEVTVRDGQGQPIGKGILDADLPPPRDFAPEPYLEPLLALFSFVLEGAPEQQAAARLGLAEQLGLDASTWSQVPSPSSPRERAAATARLAFRFPQLLAAGDDALLRQMCFMEIEPSPEQTLKLHQIAELLRNHA